MNTPEILANKRGTFAISRETFANKAKTFAKYFFYFFYFSPTIVLEQEFVDYRFSTLNTNSSMGNIQNIGTEFKWHVTTCMSQS